MGVHAAKSRPIVYDATFEPDNTIVPDGPLWPNALPGTLRSLMMGSVLSPGGKPAEAFDMLRIADACRDGKPFVNYNFSPYGDPPKPRCSIGPKNFSLVCGDFEVLNQDFSPDGMSRLINPVADHYPISVCSPEQLVVEKDGPLKEPGWKTGEYQNGQFVASLETIQAQDWATKNWWAHRLAFIECGIYFGKESNDTTTLTFIRHRLQLARVTYPNQKRIVTMWGERSPDFGGLGPLPVSLCKQLMEVLITERCEAIQLWGERKTIGNLASVSGIVLQGVQANVSSDVH